MSGLLGKKIRMTQVFDDTGKSIPVTVINAGPCYVSQIKTTEIDGYRAVQIGYMELKEKHSNKPIAGHLKKADLKPLKHLREFDLRLNEEIKVGESLENSLEVDSTEMVEIAVSLKKALNVEIGDNEIKKTHSVNEIAEILNAKL